MPLYYTDESEEHASEKVAQLVTDLSLLTAMPINAKRRDPIRAIAAANSMAYRTSSFTKKQLKVFEWAVVPLLNLLIVDLESPIASKTAFALSLLMTSRLCMGRLMESGGLKKIGAALDAMLPKSVHLLQTRCDERMLIEYLAICYREIGRFHPWEIVHVGALRHAVLILRHGDVEIQSVTSVMMSTLSTDLEICKQMFSYGAIKPIILITDGDRTNNACLLAGLGCITQLARIPEISVRVLQQGVVPVLEKALHWRKGHNNIGIREKALFALMFLSRVQSSRRALCTPRILEAVRYEFSHGTVYAKETILQFLMNVHLYYDEEATLVRDIRDDLLLLLQNGPWYMKNKVLRVFTVIYTDLEDIKAMTVQGIYDLIIDVIRAKDVELQEAPLMALIHICTHPTIPIDLLEWGILNEVVPMLFAADKVLQELCVILLKALSLFDTEMVENAVPEHKKYVLKRDLYNPQTFGSEYGGMIQDYLQTIVENRRLCDYLIKQFTEKELELLKITHEDLEMYQNLFILLDEDCCGKLGEDEIKMLMVLRGEKFDREEITELLLQFDMDNKGGVNFKEFVHMFVDWDRRFGVGYMRKWNLFWERGPIGKFRRRISQWWNRNKIQEAEVQLAKQARLNEKLHTRKLLLAFFPMEEFLEQVRKQKRIRELGLFYSPNYEEYNADIIDPRSAYFDGDDEDYELFSHPNDISGFHEISNLSGLSYYE